MARLNVVRMLKKNPRILIILAIAIIIGSLMAYLVIEINTIGHAITAQKASLKAQAFGYVIGRELLYYNNSHSLAPYLLLHYSTFNSSVLYVNASLSKFPVPNNIFILNTTNECIYCDNVSAVAYSIYSNLKSYGLLPGTKSLYIVEINSVLNMPNDSILIVLNGLMPQQFFSNVPGSNEMVIDRLLDKGTSIIYVGKNFNSVLIPGSIIVKNSNLPYYMLTNQTTRNSTFYNAVKANTLQDLFFYNQTFTFFRQSEFGYVAYANARNGTVVAFSNYVDTWAPKYAGVGIAKAISEQFWIPRYASGNVTLSLPRLNSTGNIGIVLNDTSISTVNTSISEITGSLNSTAYARLLLYTDRSYGTGNGSAYYYITYKPTFSINGSVSLPDFVIPGETVPIEMTIFSNSSAQTTIAPHITIYDINMTPIVSQPLSPFHTSGNFSFTVQKPFYTVPGKYILSLDGISGYRYASAFLYIPPISITLKSYTNNTFNISVLVNGMGLNNLNYTITVNNKYPSKGFIDNGAIYYALPSNTPTIYGDLNFSISMLSHQFNFTVPHPGVKITITGSEVDIIVVVIIVIILMAAVKAPYRDEFYLDVPSLPKQKFVEIKLKPKELIGTFDKLNLYYHWKYMPLSIEEVRTAIVNNIRYQSMPVAVTYNNVETVLNQLTGLGYLDSADELYAPREWEKSGFDIEYLAAFKKLRVWFIMHAYMFTEIGSSSSADIVATVKRERIYIVIYSHTTKFRSVPVYPNAQTYIAFLNSQRMYDFKDNLERLYDVESEKLKIYIASEQIKLIDADNPDAAFA